ncbi:hypothetical protein LMG31506_06001 [Cupriavidus yeoncheonensis]|uniref:VIT family protein n=2 Tax=Cupriavidus yeoncheonensis TaxID=1462994 RepID=A0A916N0P2_9BURK|nr:hypothetical protein [Cupriavidus yeoncheonensis]CAG2157398.1 hypothetical protein LMG31506_06001 [Cupriavidus yeoncheonensis]
MANTPKTTIGAGTTVAPDDAELREPVLDVVDRVSEMCFGLFMALTFVGAVASGAGGPDANPRTMLHAALGCNLAWGLVDAVMFLVRTLAARGQKLTLAIAVRNASDRSAAIGLMRDALPRKIRSLVTETELESMRARLAGAPTLPARPRLNLGDLLASVRIFCIVVLTTFPVALPFVLLADVRQALFVSRVLTLAMLFIAGWALGRYAGIGSWATGFGMAAGGVALTAAVIALGG